MVEGMRTRHFKAKEWREVVGLADSGSGVEGREEVKDDTGWLAHGIRLTGHPGTEKQRLK